MSEALSATDCRDTAEPQSTTATSSPNCEPGNSLSLLGCTEPVGIAIAYDRTVFVLLQPVSVV